MMSEVAEENSPRSSLPFPLVPVANLPIQKIRTQVREGPFGLVAAAPVSARRAAAPPFTIDDLFNPVEGERTKRGPPLICSL